MARYRANQAEVGRFLRSDPDLRGILSSIADRIAGRARAVAPVRTGRYKASIEVRSSSWSPLVGGPRMAFEVLADVPYATVVERGHRNVTGRPVAATADERGRREVHGHTAGHHVLARAARGI
jgi:hypothetical protein